MTKLQFRGCAVFVDDLNRRVETVFPDGSKCEATPQYDETSIGRAKSLGYGDDIWAMTVEHELSHTILAEAMNLPHSPTLYGVAHSDYHKNWREEESRVLAFQRFVREGEGDPALAPLTERDAEKIGLTLRKTLDRLT